MEDVIHLMPVQPRVRGVMKVTEQKHQWIRGHLEQDPSVTVELSFEGFTTFPSTALTYIGMWQGKQTIFEFQNGVLWRKPSEEAWALHVRPLIDKLIGYRPMKVVLPGK